jgi:molybdopterin-containing oxidoreductase family membrane subunit
MSSLSLSSAKELSGEQSERGEGQSTQWEQQSYDPRQRAPLVLGEHDLTTVTDTVVGITFNKTPTMWYVAMAVSLSLLSLLVVTIGYLLLTGVGVWGNNNTVSWGFPIINFVFWVGIGHAGTLISAILFLLRQNWRTGINRFAEAMTIFAVCCAGIFPGLHVGRVWLAYWLLPYPNELAMWPQARSPLLWDVFAVGTYATVSLLFWYMGMVPDLATLRDRSTKRWQQIVYGFLAIGWNGSSRHWMRFEKAYLLLAALATPLVLSVHSVVSFDFATSQLPGWHTTIFPPYFVAGAVFGGFAMVLTLSIPCREWFGLKDLITHRHIENMAKVMLATGLIVSYAYSIEFFMAWYSQQSYEQFVFMNRPLGPYAWAFWTMVTCNVIAPQAIWFKAVRRNVWAIFGVAIFVNVGMWFERFVIVVTSLHQDFLPSSWAMFEPTWVDLGMFIGSFGLFFTLFLLFCRFLPMVAIAEVKTVMPQAHPEEFPITFDYQPSPDTPKELQRGHWFT